MLFRVDVTRENENVYFHSKLRLRILKSAVVYGANASGKSKLFDAFAFMRDFVVNSSKEGQKGDEIDVPPFRLNSESDNEPSEFEIVFVHEDVLYRYGFEVTRKKVVAEWLYYRPKTKEIELFYRDNAEYDTHARSFSKGKTVIREGLVRENALLLSVAAQFNDETSINVVDWFKRLKSLSGLHETDYKGYTRDKAVDPVHKFKILDLLKAADLGISDIKLRELDVDELPKNLPRGVKEKLLREARKEKSQMVTDVLTTHKKFDANGKSIEAVSFSLEDDESSGTRKFFALTGPILDVIENGYTLIVDELDSKLHPNLVRRIVSLFNSKELNPKNAQLIFNTHDTNLLSVGLFRRDQIWFTEKNKIGEAKLYSLADFKSSNVKKNEPFEDNYIKGKYGAVPYLGFFDNLNNILSHYGN